MRLNINHIKKYILSDKYDFKLFNINYNISEINCINNFLLEKTNTFSHYGSIETITRETALNKFLLDLGNNKLHIINKMEKIILKLLHKVLEGYNMEYFWLDIRVMQPNNYYDIPRWHKDGAFIIGDKTEMSKFVTVVKGDGTLFIKSTKKINSEYNTINNEQMDEQRKYPYNIKLSKEQLEYNMMEQRKIGEKYRSSYAKKFKNKKIIQLDNNMGAIFFTGKDKGALHSEPKITKPRMFISILPNTKENIKKIKDFST